MGFPVDSDGKESACNADVGSISGLGRSPGGRAWQPTPVFWPGESPWTKEPGGLQSMGSQRSGHDRAIKQTHIHTNTRTEVTLRGQPFLEGVF